MNIHLCKTCGTSYESGQQPPSECAICSDERQYVPVSGQAWTTLDQLTANHRNAWRKHEEGLFSIQTVPQFGINQRALLVTSPVGNILWDCIACIDNTTIELVKALGGLKAIAISHPHYYTTMQDWAAIFDVPILLHHADRKWVMRDSPHIQFWDGDSREVLPDLKLVRLGGHFAGGAVMQWTGTSDGKPVMLVGDIVQVAPGTDRVSFMWSYPNMLPLPGHEVSLLAKSIGNHEFDRMYGAFDGQNVAAGARDIVLSSAERYLSLVNHAQRQ